MKLDPVLPSAFGLILTFGVTYIAFGGKFPFYRTPLRFALSGLLAFVVGFALFAITVASP